MCRGPVQVANVPSCSTVLSLNPSRPTQAATNRPGAPVQTIDGWRKSDFADVNLAGAVAA